MKNINLERVENLRNKVKEFNNLVWDIVEEEIKSLYDDEEFINLLLYIPRSRKGFGANRPYACFLGYLFGGGKPNDKKILRVAAALEILNVSITYIDDKIFDDDTNVGNNLSLHKKYGIPYAMIVSSSLRSLSRSIITQIALENNLKKILNELDSISIEADYGQYLDVKFGNFIYAKISDAIKINDLRTGQFIRRCAEIGYLFSGKNNSNELKTLHEAFKLYGRVVQDINDFDDVNYTEGSPGSHGADLKLFKKTKPILKALELSDKYQKKIIYSILANKYAEDTAVKLACEQIRNCGALRWAHEDALNTIRRAIKLMSTSNNKVASAVIDYFSIVQVVMKQRGMNL